MKTSVAGFPRIGRKRELKIAVEALFADRITGEELEKTAKELRKTHWMEQSDRGITYIPSNDFSLYDNMLDTALMLGVIPRRFRDEGLAGLTLYFGMARGHSDASLPPLALRKWFTTNYHYLVPEWDPGLVPAINAKKPLSEFREALDLGIRTRPTLIGPFTFHKLSRYSGVSEQEASREYLPAAYGEILKLLTETGVTCVQMEEPSLAWDLSRSDKDLFMGMYRQILSSQGCPDIHLLTCHGDIRDIYTGVMELPFGGVGLDFVDGPGNLELVGKYGFPADRELTAGIINGKNVHKNDLAESRNLLASLMALTDAPLVAGTSVSLLHVPVSLEGEDSIPEGFLKTLSFALEKLDELKILASIEILPAEKIAGTRGAKAKTFSSPLREDPEVRLPPRNERRGLQKKRFNLPPLPTTTIGSFPQTAEVRQARLKYRRGEMDADSYRNFIREKIARCLKLQEDLGLDILVHGEFERNDMTEYFGENLDGFLITGNGWVQSYGTRCVKPPIIVSDIRWTRPITVEWAVFAQGRTDKPVKGMLTGPTTIFNWSFPREDIAPEITVKQLALAIRQEVLELEKNGIGIIQVDEAAFREKLPLRAGDRQACLDLAVSAFRTVHSGIRPETQLHTHMCYSDFSDVLKEIDAMDADVITFEASRSRMEILDELVDNDFETETGPGVYDIHSPNIPSSEEIEKLIRLMLAKLPDHSRLWINPDCGLKTRRDPEVIEALGNMVKAVSRIRDTL